MKIPPPVVTLVGALILVAVDRFVPDFSYDYPGSWFIGGAIMLAGGAIDLLAAGLFRSKGTTVNPIKVENATKLVTTGLFALSRNPMYLGMAMFLLGLGIGLGTHVTPVVVVAFVIWMNTSQIAREEKAMEDLFGEEYRAYRAKVRRWI